jgi:hypothetical protein
MIEPRKLNFSTTFAASPEHAACIFLAEKAEAEAKETVLPNVRAQRLETARRWRELAAVGGKLRRK